MVTKEELLLYCKKRINTITLEKDCSQEEKDYCINCLNTFITNIESSDLSNKEVIRMVCFAENIYPIGLGNWKDDKYYSLKVIRDVFCSEEMEYELFQQIMDFNQEEFNERNSLFKERTKNVDRRTREYKKLERDYNREYWRKYTPIISQLRICDVERFIEIHGKDFMNCESIIKRKDESNYLAFSNIEYDWRELGDTARRCVKKGKIHQDIIQESIKFLLLKHCDRA